MDKLKPCPFCGSQAKMVGAHRGAWLVICHGTKCPVSPGTTVLPTEQRAATAWNTRAAQEQSP